MAMLLPSRSVKLTATGILSGTGHSHRCAGTTAVSPMMLGSAWSFSWTVSHCSCRQTQPGNEHVEYVCC
jgi:hypothetical protein